MFMTQKQVEMLRKQYPPGTRLCCDGMPDDPRPIESGTIGTVVGVDDAGQITVAPESRFASCDHFVIQFIQDLVCHISAGNIIDLFDFRIFEHLHQLGRPLPGRSGENSVIGINTVTQFRMYADGLQESGQVFGFLSVF